MIKHEVLIYNQTKVRVPKKFINNVIFKTLDFLKLKQPVELAVLIVDKREMKRLNKTWRKKNYIPDELSFGLNSRQSSKFAKIDFDMLKLGEIVINGDKIADKKHFSKILIHALLHLLGHHHEKSTAEAKKTERLERIILKQLGI